MIPTPDLNGRLDRRHGTPELLASVDLDLIQITYAFVVGETQCARCRRPLRSAFRIEVYQSVVPGRSWTGFISFRCSGWRRHRNEASISLREDGLHLGRPGRPV